GQTHPRARRRSEARRGPRAVESGNPPAARKNRAGAASITYRGGRHVGSTPLRSGGSLQCLGEESWISARGIEACLARRSPGPVMAGVVDASEEPPTASILILTRHGPQRLERCLAALARLPDPVSREILLLLNDADDDVCGMLDAYAARSRVLESP